MLHCWSPSQVLFTGHGGVGAVGGQQLLMRATFQDSAVLHKVDAPGALHAGQPVCDAQAGGSGAGGRRGGDRGEGGGFRRAGHWNVECGCFFVPMQCECFYTTVTLSVIHRWVYFKVDPVLVPEDHKAECSFQN